MNSYRKLMRDWALRWRANVRQFGHDKISALCVARAKAWRDASECCGPTRHQFHEPLRPRAIAA
jgi:hypothetical protein